MLLRSAYECGAYRIYGRGCTDNVEEWYTLRWQKGWGMKAREEIGRESDQIKDGKYEENGNGNLMEGK